MATYVGALDQGTSSTRFIVFDQHGQIISVDQKEHKQIYPQPGWVEHNPLEIWQNTQEVIRGALAKGKIAGSELAA
ncbi:MAG: FGGY family carbohydrate kinase, partial [Methanoregulaceae archaeon]|nr:FGGY family carbohydrate kinase [Methanoregulaceae archaeon]